jgi:decaprenylphospho-beta-D-erythro-pentofuranosid-2-ulose 2-reductase
VAQRRVLVVGATSAVAGEVAVLFAAEGAQLYLVGGRSRSKLDALCERLGAAVRGAETADIDELANNAGCVERAIAALGGLDLVFVATGYLGDQLSSERDLAEAERIYRTNLLGVVSVLMPVANYFESNGPGHIVVVSSVAADRGRPRNYTYASAKAALNVYLEGLRSRLYPAGTCVQVVKLGPVHSPMTVDHPKNALFASPERVARDLLSGIASRSPTLYVPWFWWPIMFVVRNLPQALFQRVRSLSGR